MIRLVAAHDELNVMLSLTVSQGKAGHYYDATEASTRVVEAARSGSDADNPDLVARIFARKQMTEADAAALHKQEAEQKEWDFLEFAAIDAVGSIAAGNWLTGDHAAAMYGAFAEVIPRESLEGDG
jgi:hypothetical protein